MYLLLHNLLNRINVSINVQMKNPGPEESSLSNDINNKNNNGTTSQTKNDEKVQQNPNTKQK